MFQKTMIEKDLVRGENDIVPHSISIIRTLLSDDEFKDRHRINTSAFSRFFKLGFVMVILLILQKSVKSSQLVLNEFFKKLGSDVLVTNSAFRRIKGVSTLFS